MWLYLVGAHMEGHGSAWSCAGHGMGHVVRARVRVRVRARVRVRVYVCACVLVCACVCVCVCACVRSRFGPRLPG